MAEYVRLSAQDASFLHAESPETPMHVGSLAMLEGEPLFDGAGRLRIEDFRSHVESRLHLVPLFRKKLMEVPFGQGRPVWVDDDSFDISYHVRITALPAPGNEEQLKLLCARLQSHLLDRSKPLWELWVVEGLEGGRVGLIQKTHHALVDGVSGVDVATVLLDFTPEPAEYPHEPWEPAPAPNPIQLLVESLWQRGTEPTEIVRSIRGALRGPRRVVKRAAELATSFSTMLSASTVAPKTSLNQRIGQHRRFEGVRTSLDDVKATKNALGGTVNDVVLAGVTSGLRQLLLARGEPVDGVTLRAMVPVSVRDESEHMQLGNRVSAMFVPLPVGEDDPIIRLRIIQQATRELKERKQAVGAEFLVQMTEYAPQTVLSLASRLAHRQRFANLVITNVPGPQQPLYVMGAEMLEAFPIVPLVGNTCVGIAILSYNGQLNLGLHADRDTCTDLALLAEGMEKSFSELRHLASPV
ncbi:MAG: wax ester/triacylglycerol synthase family O-acyltransferase [Actinobacteria bacterium]|nr:wax ester/triacylglycerol synthase family O-acyltransferase [Actinomycetota bacterium]